MPSDQRPYEKLPLSTASHQHNQWAHKEALRVAIGSILAPVSALVISKSLDRLTQLAETTSLVSWVSLCLRNSQPLLPPHIAVAHPRYRYPYSPHSSDTIRRGP